MEQTLQSIEQVITPAELLRHWRGHRDLTRRVIAAFPEEQLFSFSIGGMRTFSAMIMELLGIGAPGLREMVSGNQGVLDEHTDHQNKKETVLQLWDAASDEIDSLLNKIPIENFHESVLLFGMYKGTVMSSILYFIDNEIHHRAQGYVYLRALGIEPPPFWDRA